MEAKVASKITRLDPWTMCFVPGEGCQQDVVPKRIWEISASELDAMVNGKFNLGDL